MFQYLNIPHPDPDPALESGEIGVTVAAAFQSHSQHDSTNPAQHLHFPIPAVAMSLVHPEPPNSSQKFDTSMHNQPVTGFLHHQLQDSHRQYSQLSPTHQRTHTNDPLHSLSHANHAQLHPQSALPYPSHSFSGPLPMLQPPSNLHIQSQPFHASQSPWHNNHGKNAPSSSVLPTPTSHFTPRLKAHLPVGRLVCNTPASLIPLANNSQVSSPGKQLTMVRRDPHSGKRTVRRGEQNGTPDFSRRSPRKRQKRSFVWNFFEETDNNPNVALCLICKDIIPRGRNLARNTTNLRKHLEHRHPNHMKDGSENLISHFRKPGRTTLVHSSNAALPVGSPKKSKNRNTSLNFSNLQPCSELLPSCSEPLPLFTEQINNNISSANKQSIVNDRSILVAPNVMNGTSQAVWNGHHRTMEECSADIPGGSERDFSGANMAFTDSMAYMAQFRPKSTVEDRRGSFDQIDRDVTNRLSDSNKSAGTCTISRHINDIDVHEQLFPTDAVLSKSREVDTGLIDCLAIMELPLAASKSKGFTALFAGASINVMFPSISRMRASILPAQVETLQMKVKKLLSKAEKVVIIAEAADTNKTLICRYIEQGSKVKHVCLGVIPRNHIAEDTENNQIPLISNNCQNLSPSKIPCVVENGLKPQNERTRKLVEHIDWAIEKWGIREKVIAVVMPGKSLEPGKPRFLMREEHIHLGGKKCLCCQESSSSSAKCHQPRNCTGPPPPVQHSSFHGLYAAHYKIPVIQCLVSTLEVIVISTVCENRTVERCFIEPMSKGIFIALADRRFLEAENGKSRPATLSLPLVNLSLEELLDVLEYFSEHFDRIQTVLKEHSGENDIDLLCMCKEDLDILHDLLVPFADTIQLVKEKENHGSALMSRQVSFAIPAMRQLSEKLECIYGNAAGKLKGVAKGAFQAVKLQCENMQSHELYSSATLLDPHFKSSYFSEQHLSRAAQERVTCACENESIRYEKERRVNRMHGSLDLPSGSSNLDNFLMNSMSGDRNMLLSSLTAYVDEPVVDFGNPSLKSEDYWKRNQNKWPVLARVALQYALIPSTSRADRRNAALGDYNKDLVGDEANDAHALAFLRNNLLLVDGLSILSSR